jgi:2-methylcitrate dehydratase PrpD
VGKLLGLNQEEMVNAFGIAYAQVSGNRQMVIGSTAQTRGLQAAFSGQAAILSSLLAQRGFTGAKDSLEGGED